MDHIVNISLQILPSSKSHNTYEIVDQAIKVIADSGLKFKVCPFETVMEGPYDQIMETIKKANIICLKYGADSLFANIKMQIIKNTDVRIHDKLKNFE